MVTIVHTHKRHPHSTPTVLPRLPCIHSHTRYTSRHRLRKVIEIDIGKLEQVIRGKAAQRGHRFPVTVQTRLQSHTHKTTSSWIERGRLFLVRTFLPKMADDEGGPPPPPSVSCATLLAPFSRVCCGVCSCAGGCTAAADVCVCSVHWLANVGSVSKLRCPILRSVNAHHLCAYTCAWSDLPRA